MKDKILPWQQNVTSDQYMAVKHWRESDNTQLKLCTGDNLQIIVSFFMKTFVDLV